MAGSARQPPDGIALALFAHRVAAICDEMGAQLARSAFSPNIRDRLDFSCALFDAAGELFAQAAHIPVHLGAMAHAMRDLVQVVAWQPGDVLMVNDPYLGGTHLPDVTLIAPAFLGGRLCAFAACRAHHADIGASAPGSMPLSRHLDEEGLVIPPTLWQRGGRPDTALLARLHQALGDARSSLGDLAAQTSALRLGVARIEALAAGMGGLDQALASLQDYAAGLAATAWARLPAGDYHYTDYLDDDGLGSGPLPIRVAVACRETGIRVDFTGTAAQVEGNVNCPLSVAAAAVYYVLRCLLPPQTPNCAGAFRDISLQAPAGCLLNARRPAAVAAGNVETSSRVVDTLLGALAPALPMVIPAASQGSMNNLAMGARGRRPWDYYETLGGGMGGGPRGAGLDAVQTHMTNTRNTPIEVLETRYPLRVRRYAIRRGSGGAGRHPGGAGLIREYEFLAPAQATLLTERRRLAPWGLAGGGPGRCGVNTLNGRPLPGKCQLQLQPGDRLCIATPGGGGWGPPGQS